MRETVDGQTFNKDEAVWVGDAIEVEHKRDTMFRALDGQCFIVREIRSLKLRGVDGSYGCWNIEESTHALTPAQVSCWLSENHQGSAREKAGVESKGICSEANAEQTNQETERKQGAKNENSREK